MNSVNLSRGGDAPVFVVLEPSPVTNVLQSLYQRESSPQWHWLFADTDWAPYRQESPWVIQVSARSEFLQWATTTLASPDARLRGLVLEPGPKRGAVADWLRQGLETHTKAGRQALLRYYDPQIWGALAPANRGDGSVVASVHYWCEGARDWCQSLRPGLPGHRSAVTSQGGNE